jgi:hypothetical protein
MQIEEYDQGRGVQRFAVIDDPAGEYWDGAVVGEDRARVLRARRAVCMPINPRLYNTSGVGGYFFRRWGSGYPLDSNIPRANCPMVMYVSKELRVVTWAARIVGDLKRSSGGILRLVPDSSQPYLAPGGLAALGNTPVQILADQLGEADEDGGWTIVSTAKLGASADGFQGFALYGHAPGMRVIWSAISLS